MAKVQQIKGSIYIRSVQDNELGLVKYRKDRKDHVALFLSKGLGKDFTVGTHVCGTIIQQYNAGVVSNVLVNVQKDMKKNASTRKTTKKLMMAKSGGKKKKGTVTNIEIEESRIIISSDMGFNFVAYGSVFIPVGTMVEFTDSGLIDPATGLMIATHVNVEQE